MSMTMARRPPAIALKPGQVRVWACRADALSDSTARDLSAHWFDTSEQDTAERFRFARDAHQYRVAHALLRRVATLHTGLDEAAITFTRDSHGRPHLDGAGFDMNLSHTSGWSAVAAGKVAHVGVDVETDPAGDPRRAASLRSVADTFAPAERQYLDTLPEDSWTSAVIRLWTLKEAFMKAVGLGLAIDPADVSFVLPSSAVGLWRGENARIPTEFADRHWWFGEYRLDGAYLALAVATEGLAPTVSINAHGFPWWPTAAVDWPTKG